MYICFCTPSLWHWHRRLWYSSLTLLSLRLRLARWKQWQRKCSDDSETANWLNTNTKPCPKCQNQVEKNGGCNLVVCRCGQVCWTLPHTAALCPFPFPKPLFKMANPDVITCPLPQCSFPCCQFVPLCSVCNRSFALCRRFAGCVVLPLADLTHGKPSLGTAAADTRKMLTRKSMKLRGTILR